MIFWPFCAFIWFKNIEKMLLQMTSGFLQLESTLGTYMENIQSKLNSVQVAKTHLSFSTAFFSHF
jgi:hypothetical protein